MTLRQRSSTLNTVGLAYTARRRGHADAIMDRIIHNAEWIETGSMNMRERCSKHRL
jgi:hypothetical protein